MNLPLKIKIQELKNRIMDGYEITQEEALMLMEANAADESETLFQAAREIAFHFNGTEPAVCALVNAKSYMCGEDCAFCAQSVHYETEAEKYRLMSAEEVLKIAKPFENSGVLDFCVMTSEITLSDTEFEKIKEIYRLLAAETSLRLDGSLGFLDEARIRRLKGIGVRRINSNVQSSCEFYPKIVSTHTYEDRIEGLKGLQKAGMEICSGGILGMGETREDRIRMAFELKPFQPKCFPVNILNPRPGTPLEHQEKLPFMEIAKTVAVYRFIHPRADLKLAGGREANLTREEQEIILKAGANGLITGGYLTTGGNAAHKDFEMLEQCGFYTAGGDRRVQGQPTAQA